MIRIAALAVLALCSWSPALAQETEPDIVVTGERTEEAVRNFVGAMSEPGLGTDQLGRWNRSICAGVAGLRSRYAQFVVDRMAQRTFEIDLNVGERGCNANVLIIVSTDPDGIARNLYENHRRALGYYDDLHESTRGRAAFRDTFLNSDAPVRWWHVSGTASAGGQLITRASAGPCRSRGSTMLSLQSCYPTNQDSGGVSRLRARTQEQFRSAFIIVDANRLPEIGNDFNVLADYIAMVTLAQLDPEADVSAYPTVLNLWRSNPAPAAMTDWDIDYLRALYAPRSEAVNVRRQESNIAHEMLRE